MATPTPEALAMWATGHEKLCGERHGMTDMRLGRIEKWGATIAGAIIVMLGTILWELLKTNRLLS